MIPVPWLAATPETHRRAWAILGLAAVLVLYLRWKVSR